MGREKREIPRELILNMTMRYIVDVGVTGFSVDEVAYASEVSVRMLYEAFPSRVALLSETYLHYFRELDRPAGRYFAVPTNAREDFFQWWNRLSNLLAHEWFGPGFLELQNIRTSLSPAAADCHGSRISELTNYVEVYRNAGALKQLPTHLLTQTIWGILTGMIGAGGAGSIHACRVSLSAARDCAWDAIRKGF